MLIEELLKSPESKTLEFKQDLSSPKKVMRAIVAFSNSAGGTIIIGVNDKTKEVVGVDNPYQMEHDLSNLISDHIAPQILPEIEIIPWRNFYLLVVQVFPSSVRPHYLKQEGLDQGTYIRVGSSNRLADGLMQAELRRVRIGDSFDKQPMANLNSEALDFRVVSELFAENKRLTQRDLESLDLVTSYHEKKVPTIGGTILFGKDRLKHFPDAWIQVGRFQGITKTKIFDSQEIKTYPILAIEEVMQFIKKHAMHGIEIPGSRHSRSHGSGAGRGGGFGDGSGYGAGSGDGAGSTDGTGYDNRSLRHQVVWSLPITAIREAIINAVVHADYSQQGAPIRLSIFDDRVEIENPGLLLFGLTVEEIKRGVSKLRNRVIGQVFYRLGLIERWGSGVRRIIDSCKDAGFPEPLFEEIGTHFRVTLYTQPIESPRLNVTDQAIITVLKHADGLSTKEISEKIGKSARMTRSRLVKLIECGLVIELGSGLNDPLRKYFIKR